MEEKDCYNKIRWINLLAFGFLYNMVYLARFNVNNSMENIASEVYINEFQQQIISASVFISYALGSLICGYLADKYGARRTVAVGVGISIYANIMVALSGDWRLILFWWILNGFAQSIIWLSGISLIVKWWNYKDRGLGVGLINFFSGLSHMTAYVFPMILISIAPNLYWRVSFFISMGVLFGFLIIFCWKVISKPEDIGILPCREEQLEFKVKDKELKVLFEECKSPRRYFFKQKKFWLWCAIAMLSSVCRYGLLTWIPMYYRVERGQEMLSPTFSNLMLPLGMAFGTWIITWCAGSKFSKNLGMVVVSAAALCGTLVFIFPMLEEKLTILVGIFFSGFFLYGINGILWLYAMEKGERYFSGTVAGILNCFAYLGAGLEMVIFPFIIKALGQILTVFLLMEFFCIAMIICGIVVSNKDTRIEPEIKE